VELRIDPNWQPVPDVIATLKPIKDYPTEPVEIVVEILSPEDKLIHVIKKCHQYERIGTERIICAGSYRKVRLAVEVGKPRSHHAIGAA
jgi:Uma2 family endonuclease